MKKITLLLSFFTAIILLAACTDYGKKIKSGHIETYYKDGITEAEAQKTTDLLVRMDAGNEPTDKSFQLCKKSDSIYFRMVVNKDKENNANDFNFLAICNIISDSIFNGAPVNMDLTDDHFKTQRTLLYKKLTQADVDQAK